MVVTGTPDSRSHADSVPKTSSSGSPAESRTPASGRRARPPSLASRCGPFRARRLLRAFRSRRGQAPRSTALRRVNGFCPAMSREKGEAMDLSYAQNLEDYHLARLFAGQADGFYIDVGAGHPVADNVSFWFYLQGWRGLVVEPQQDLAAIYAHIRPRDIAICGLVGRSIGEADFHLVERLHGFSTTDEAHARGAAAFGAGFRTVRMPATTLAALCEAHAPSRVDFLKVDVEGAEAEV